MDRQVRQSIIIIPLNLNLFFFFPPHLNDLSNGYETCDGLSNLARALIGLAFCTYHPIDQHHKFSFPRSICCAPSTPLTQQLTNSIFPDPNSGRPPQTKPVLVFLGILFSLFTYRRRRNRRANLAYIQQVQPGTGAAYNGAGGPPPFAPQYPPPAHNGLNYPYNYDPSSGFAPVRDEIFPIFVHFADARVHARCFFLSAL